MTIIRGKICHALPCCALVLATALTRPASAQTQSPEPDESPEPDDGAGQDGAPDDDGPAYGTKGAMELGGSVALAWTEPAFSLEVSPSVGYFIIDRLELSALLRISYESQEDEQGERTSLKGGAFVIEPSYHLPLREELFLLSGLGLGVGHDGDNFDFEVIPRVGLNIGVGLVGVLTPAARVPIIIDSDGTNVGLGFEVGYSVTW